MSLNLKIKIPSQGTSKIMRFAEQMSVHEVCKTIQEKTTVGGKDHALFVPSPEGDQSSCGRWLKPERTLEYYDLKTNDTVEYKKKHDVIKVKLVDDTVKTILVDLSIPVTEVVDFIGKKISIKNADEFSLQAESKPGVWLKNTLPITEQVGTLDQVFLLKKKFFMNDANVDQDDPVQLHLVYCQSRDDIVSGRHPVTKDEAVNFGALQCQIQLGDYKPETHKPGYVQLKDFLAPQWTKKKEIEKLLLAEWKKLVGMNEVNARFRYVQLCRSLKTYGMTVFKVKEKVPGKKKLMNCLLAFTRDSIMRMEFESKRVIKEYPFKHLLRWAASPETFTMDFGAHEEDYVVVVTNEGEAISGIIAGYIDLLLKKQRDTGVVIDDDGADTANVSSIARIGGLATTSLTSGMVSGGDVGYSQSATDCSTAAKAIEKMINDLFGEVAKISDSNLTPGQRREQIEAQARALAALAETIENFAKTGDRTAMNGAAHKIAAAVEQLIGAARQAAASGADPNGILMDATKGVSDALRSLLAAAQTAANKPNDPEAKEALIRAQLAAQAALQKLAAASKGVYADDGYQQLFKEMAKAVNAESKMMLNTAEAATARIADPAKKQQMQTATGSLAGADQNFAKISEILAPVASETACKTTIEKAGKALEASAAYLSQQAKNSGLDPASQNALSDSHRRLQEALQNLLGMTDLPHLAGAKEAEEFTEAAQAILQSCAAIMAAEGNPNLVKTQCAEVKNNATKLGTAGKGLIAAQTDAPTKERLANYLKGVVEASKNLLTAAPAAIQSPSDASANAKLQTAAAELSEATHQLIGDTGRQVAVSALYNSAKLAAATTTSLCTSARMANGKMSDPSAQQQLAESSRAAAEAVQKLVSVLKDASKAAPEAPSRRTTFNRRQSTVELLKDDIMQAAEKFAPVAYKLVSTSKGVSPKVDDSEAKQDLVYCSSNAAKAIHKMLSNRKAMKAVKGQLETAEAIEEFKAAQADLESAIIACDTGILQPTKSKDDALADLASAITELGSASKEVATTAKAAPEDLGPAMKKCAAATTKAVIAGSALAASVEDKSLQKAILYALRAATGEVKNLMNVSKAVAASPEDPNLNKLLLNAGQSVANALMKLTEASKGVVPKFVEEHQSKAQSDIEDLAEKELQGAADAIERCVAKLNAATEAARQRALEKGIAVDEQNITEAILEAAQAIAKSTAILVNAATAVQREFQALVKEPKTSSVYRRDPQWAQGLISAAKTVAGTVQHLVQTADNAARGNVSEEALVVAAQAVSAATAQLVTASTVKADPNSESQRKLRDASTRVTQATQQLVTAARNAAQWEEEKVKEEENEKYNLTGNKVKEMEKQMEILRLEKELEKARAQLGTMRKNEYSDAGPGPAPAPVRTNPNRPGPARGPGGPPPSDNGQAPVRGPPGPGPVRGPGGPGPAPGPARGPGGPGGPVPGRRGPPGRVNWNTSAIVRGQ